VTGPAPLLRDCLALRQKHFPDSWLALDTQLQCGGALLGQQMFAEAEPLLVQGYEGMKQREAKIPADDMVRLSEARERLVQLYQATVQDEKAAEWRKKR
jgi:hypothetical protein